MHRLLLAGYLFLSTITFGQKTGDKPYWQQKLVYDISAKVNPQQHTVEGMLHLQYTNQSPDTLTFIWFHLWANAHANDSTAMAKQVARLQLPKFSLVQKKEGPGYINNLHWKVDGLPAPTEPHKEWIDVVKLLLSTPLLPGATITISTSFTTQLPDFSFRSGYVDSALFVAHWYPKPAVYDQHGWHPMPYLEMGEYYSEFGKYTVDITLPPTYVVAATGTLQTTEEAAQYREMGQRNRRYTDSIWQKRKNVKNATVRNGLTGYHYKGADTLKTIRFYADSVHDFAFFTDNRFIVDYDTIQLPSGKIADVYTFYRKENFQRWNAAIDNAKSALRFYSGQVGEYPYPAVSVVQGPEAEGNAGIEYPTAALILLSNTTSDQAVESVMVHEVGHNWFYGILANNERDYGWMDEGFNTFFQQRYDAEKNRYTSVVRFIPEMIRSLSLPSFEEYLYETIDDMPYRAAIYQPATDFTDFSEYYMVTYYKTAGWLYALEQKLGKPTFAQCMKAYFFRWKFKHPYPQDLFKVFEQVSGQNLSEFFKQIVAPRQRFNTKN